MADNGAAKTIADNNARDENKSADLAADAEIAGTSAAAVGIDVSDSAADGPFDIELSEFDTGENTVRSSLGARLRSLTDNVRQILKRDEDAVNQIDKAATDDSSADIDPDADDVIAPEEADDVRRFLDRRRPWRHPLTNRDRRRRTAAAYWSFVYVLLMAGATSLAGFLIVRGYLAVWPSPTSTGASTARSVVPWVFFAVFIAFSGYVTRNVRRTVGYGIAFLAPYLVFVFVNSATDFAVWIVGWIPGNAQVYGLAALGPFVALSLLARDFVRWQLWVEYPNDSCWECSTQIKNERWTFCPTCGADLQAQRVRQAEDEQAELAERRRAEIDITTPSVSDDGAACDENSPRVERV